MVTANKIVWVMQELAKPRKSASGKLYTTMKTKIYIDCEEDTWEALSEYLYNKDGKLVESNKAEVEREGDVNDIIPGSFMEKIKNHELACG